MPNQKPPKSPFAARSSRSTSKPAAPKNPGARNSSPKSSSPAGFAAKPSGSFARKSSSAKKSPYAAPQSSEPATKPAPKKAVSGSTSEFRKPAGKLTSFPRSAAAPRQQQPARTLPTRTLPANLPGPCAVVTRRASESLRTGHLWVYASDIEAVLPSQTGDTPSLIPVVDNRGIPLGTALYSPSSQIALRMVSREILTSQQWQLQLADRLRTAIARRRPMLNDDTDACRLVFSEADNLPGLIVDKYAGIVILQLLAKGLDNPETRETCTRVLVEELAITGNPLTIWERPDPRIRELEGLSAPATTPLFTNNPQAPVSSTIFRLNGLSFHFDANSGQKTGAFLDQRQNYAAAAAWAKKYSIQKALDVCTYQGGFALHLAQVTRHVTGIDASRSSLETAERNLETNQSKLTAEVDWLEADAFELLRNWSDSKTEAGLEAPAESTWDLIVLDPPAFAKSKRAVEGAMRGYKELNLRALRMIRPGGLLITCSCSHHVGWSDLESAVASAAIDAHRQVTLLERRGAALDHPVLLNLPETEYLKCLICQVD